MPKELLVSLRGLPGFDEDAFMQLHESGAQVTSIRYNPLKLSLADRTDGPQMAQRVPWSSQGFYLPQRPSFTLDPEFHAGVYYVQEASGMFLEQALKQTVDLSEDLRILDLCAAPGGKSTLLQSFISEESLLVSNEVIRPRVNILRENMIKWGGANVFVTNNDPADFSRLLNYFDVIVVDAPCSGSGLFRRDPDSIQEWSLDQVALCSRRQERILADAWLALKVNGILIYATCSFSKQEDEDILDWLMSTFAAESVDLKVEPDWKIIEVVSDKCGAYGYRFYPDQLKGEGFFIGCLRKKDGSLFSYPNNKKQKIDKLSRSEETRLNSWIETQVPFSLYRRDDHVHGLPTRLLRDISFLQSTTYIKKAGIRIGKWMAPDLIPDHELALSGILSRNRPSVQLSKEQSMQYLRKEDIKIDSRHKGWALAKYGNHSLGWIKILEKRINNYYPKEWRVKKSE